MIDRVLGWFGSSEFMPHGHCYLWRPGLVWLHVSSDLLIALSYFVIPLGLVAILRRRRDLPFHWMFLCFGVFIVTCGATHALEVWNVWRADYWLAGGVKSVTAIASAATAVLFVRLVPTIVELPTPGQLAVANRALAAANQDLESFSYSVAHDLRAPLRGLDGFSQALEEDCADRLSPEGREYLQRIRGEARRMEQLVDGLLDLARLNRAPLERADVDLSEVAGQVVAGLRKADPERRVEVEIQPDVHVEGDARLLEVVLHNLLSNAWKFTGRRDLARIWFGAQGERDGRIVCFVRDDGVGFDMAHGAKLFAPFQRAHGETEFPGTGIGLATVKRIVERHHGRVWVEAAPGAGATFFVALPASTPTMEKRS